MLRSTLLKLSESEAFARWVTSNRTTRRMSHRFVAGEALEEAISAARVCNDQGMAVSLDYLGENVSTAADAQRARDAYLEVFDRIAAEKLNANVSCKLTQLGLDLSSDFCEGQVLSIVERAAHNDNFLRVDMEGSDYTERTIEVVKRVRSRSPAVGTVIQAYLYRSEQDIHDLPKKEDVDANYVKLVRLLLPSGFYHGIATHDPRMIGATIRCAAEMKISKEDFEFQMLYGVRTDLQRRLVRDGYRVRIYIPYGRDWFPYFMRRLAERPANLAFFARNFFR